MTPGTPAGGLALAAGWYIALASSDLGARPRELDLFGRELAAWRDGGGRAVVVPRHCPHLNASLALGKVVDGSLRCPFHHWRFDASGACVAIPGVRRIPPTARLRPYPVVERHGFVWAWYGGDEPLYPLPEFPALETGPSRYLTYRFAHRTPASPRRILENAFDHYHFMTLHGVRSAEDLRLTMLTDPGAASENGPPIAADAWLGARLESHDLQLPKALTALGITGKRFALLVDGWPGGQRLTFFLDGEVVAKELLGITPVADGHTVFQGWSLVRRTGRPLRDASAYLMYRAQHWLGTREDLAIYRTADDAHAAVPVPYDHSVLAFRKHYRTWVRRAERAERREQVTS
ncbi:aromatic ring-hydroxylating dioxygenase subunit alpha [Streptomyces sp. NBC_00212]|uniref:aromatic ring-hydroxylating dioxygenase subunit alpha n=1 Tax=Streptomyces sp. NBC_00212 TaxID=2975684 RepID=UPI0032536870